MKFGVCAGPALAVLARDLGYDYFEWSVVELLQPRADEAAFMQSLDRARAVGLPFPAANIFLPADLKVTGPAANPDALQAYAATALRRAEIAGLEIIGFGAGGARRVPDGFDPLTAWQQMVDFCRWLGPIARQHGVTIAIEPLNTGETNLINTAEEAAALIAAVDHPNVRLEIDGYHWAKDGNAPEGITSNAHLLAHAHIATAEGRRPPHAGDRCEPFLTALQATGYQGRLSFEGSLQDPRGELAEALEILRAWAAD